MKKKKNGITTTEFKTEDAKFTLTVNRRSKPLNPDKCGGGLPDKCGGSLIDLFDQIGAGVKELYKNRDPLTNYPPEVLELVGQAHQEVSELWEYVWADYERRSMDTEEERTPLKILMDSPLKWFKKNRPHFIKREFLKSSNHLFKGITTVCDKEGYFETKSQIKRVFIGMLYQSIISDCLPDILTKPASGKKFFGFKPLKDLHHTLHKESI